VHYSICIN